MIFKPAIIALLTGSALVCVLLAYSCYFAALIIREWDLESGSELQLSLEDRTYLISTAMAYAFAFQMVSLFLFVYTADHLHAFFVGAMCAAGTLNANSWGYPLMILKAVNFLLAGLWLILNYIDNTGYDYPLIRKKYIFLIVISPFIIEEGIMQVQYFMNLNPDIITSCCGKQFSGDAVGVASDIAILAPKWVMAAFYCIVACTMAAGITFYRIDKLGYPFALAGACTFTLSIIAIISFISPYIYELPTHHCPFCILQGEYGFIGYPIYLALFGGAVFSMGTGLLMPFRHIKSLENTLPLLQKRLALLSLVSFGIFILIVAYRMVSSNLVV